MAAFALVGWLVSWQWDLAYFTAFAFNSIVIDVEDNQKGGWLNP